MFPQSFKYVASLFPHPLSLSPVYIPSMFPHTSSLSPVYFPINIPLSFKSVTSPFCHECFAILQVCHHFPINVSPILQVCRQSIFPSMFPILQVWHQSIPHQCFLILQICHQSIFQSVFITIQVCHQSIFPSVSPNLRIMIQRDSSICFYWGNLGQNSLIDLFCVLIPISLEF